MLGCWPKCTGGCHRSSAQTCAHPCIMRLSRQISAEQGISVFRGSLPGSTSFLGGRRCRKTPLRKPSKGDLVTSFRSPHVLPQSLLRQKIPQDLIYFNFLFALAITCSDVILLLFSLKGSDVNVLTLCLVFGAAAEKKDLLQKAWTKKASEEDQPAISS